MGALAQHCAYDLFVAGLAYIRGSLIHGFGPDLVIRQPVRGYDAERRKFAMQISDSVRARSFAIERFQIEHQDVGSLPGNGGSNFLIVSYEVNWPTMVG
jgi:hypothetical protein